MPDLFEGDPIPLNRPADFDIMKWLTTSGPSKGHTKEQVDPIVEKIIKDMKDNQGVKKIGAVGYCFGAKYVARFMTGGKGVDVGYMAHPSFVDADEVKALTGPLSIAAAGAYLGNGKDLFRSRLTIQQRPTRSSPRRSDARRKTSSRICQSPTRSPSTAMSSMASLFARIPPRHLSSSPRRPLSCRLLLGSTSSSRAAGAGPRKLFGYRPAHNHQSRSVDPQHRPADGASKL